MSKELTVEQGTPEWFAARLGIATASRFKDIMARTPAPRNNYMAELVAERLTGEREESYKSSDMQWGNDYEAVARLTYKLNNPDKKVRDCGIFLHDKIACGASPDGLVDEDGTIEIKCPKTATHIQTLKSGKLPTQYFWQVQGQLLVTGRKWCDFISYDPRLPENASYICIRVERDEVAIARLAESVDSFMKQVASDTELLKGFNSVRLERV